MAGYKNPFRLGMVDLLLKIPKDGCLIVFNAKAASWRTVLSRFGGYSMKVLNPFNFIENKYKDKNIRDLYITKKEGWD